MSAAAKTLLALLTLAAAGCGDPSQQSAQANNTAAISDVEQLPPDESVATTSGELANGVDEPQADPLADNGAAP
jgi:hypothetical protein